MSTENRSSNTQAGEKLSPCPFCGQQDAFVEQLDSDASVVICQGRIDEHSACLARGPVGVQQHECEGQPGHDQAVKEWNKRAAAQLHADPGEVEQLRRELDLRTQERDKFLAWCRDARAEATKLRDRLGERESRLFAIAGWTDETRSAVLDAFQDELNESASYPWYDAAIADLMKLIEALSANTSPSAPTL